MARWINKCQLFLRLTVHANKVTQWVEHLTPTLTDNGLSAPCAQPATPASLRTFECASVIVEMAKKYGLYVQAWLKKQEKGVYRIGDNFTGHRKESRDIREH
ncbi:hypothetical protein PoB_001066700 [Plakobranchus ocellatus]|uniref:Uncharacterized protein n=1 Tax=Plakobranchus ocellatus TaxID=259542 RepID=A0AAV3YP07_9GAST|nr:hypothetical protein PoB_001066700 [Plakobranchus ocellatus]